MEKIKENLIPLCFLLSLPISNIFYKILNNPSRGAYSLMTDIDRAVPFLKIFILPYVMWYPFILFCLMYLCFKNRKVYYRVLISINIGLICCYIIYYFFQTTVLRPELVGNDLLTKMVSIIYGYDNPYNCFPSLHVTTTYLVMRGVNKSKNYIWIGVVVNIIGILIILSTQFVKQHVVLDMISAIIMNEIIFRIVTQIGKEGINVWVKKIFSLLTMKKRLEN